MIGAGKYDAACTLIRVVTKAQGVLVIVINGYDGSGFSCQADLVTTRSIPDILENIAAQIRRDGVVAAGSPKESL